MANGVLIKASDGIYLMGSIQCSNKEYFDAEGCFKYCQADISGFRKGILSGHQASKLLASSTLLGREKNDNPEWYKDRSNFIDVDINYDVDQTYKRLS